MDPGSARSLAVLKEHFKRSFDPESLKKNPEQVRRGRDFPFAQPITLVGQPSPISEDHLLKSQMAAMIPVQTG